MTNKKGRKEDMLIGNHFGKRKPQWNFFIKGYESFKYSWSMRLIKILTLNFIAQIVILSPVVYWIYQNYALIEAHVPIHFNLRENIQFEKKWIVFLILGTVVTQCVFNFFLWKSLMKESNVRNVVPFHPKHSNAKSASRDEADYQRHAS